MAGNNFRTGGETGSCTGRAIRLDFQETQRPPPHGCGRLWIASVGELAGVDDLGIRNTERARETVWRPSRGLVRYTRAGVSLPSPQGPGASDPAGFPRFRPRPGPGIPSPPRG